MFSIDGPSACRFVGEWVWEVRTRLTTGRIARVLICFHDGTLYALHGFIKKTQQTPNEDLGLARKRMKDVERG